MLAQHCESMVDLPSTASSSSITRLGIALRSMDANLRDEAARKLLPYFQNQLIGVIRRRLDARIIRRAGLEDIIQEIWLEFTHAELGRNWRPSNRTELWNQLLHFSICHVTNVALYHCAKKRDFRRESQSVEDWHVDAGSFLEEPFEDSFDGPEAKLIAREWIDAVLELLPPNLRDVFRLKCEGYSNAEIARLIDRKRRTVELRMKLIRSILQPMIQQGSLLAS